MSKDTNKIEMKTVNVSGVELEMLDMGDGPPMLFLHAAEGPTFPSDEYLRLLAKSFRVIAPWHPGFGNQVRPKDFREVSDLAYLYLDLVEQLELDHPILAGASFGGWIAAEMAVRSPATFASVVLVSPLGIKVRGREDRDIVDMFAVTDEDLLALSFKDPTKGGTDLSKLSEEELTAVYRGRESLAYYGWRPYMHNPRLKRWLSRVRIPSLLLAGHDDQIVFEGYHKAYSEALPDCQFAVIKNAGHYPHIEQSGDVTTVVTKFCQSVGARASATAA